MGAVIGSVGLTEPRTEHVHLHACSCSSCARTWARSEPKFEPNQLSPKIPRKSHKTLHATRNTMVCSNPLPDHRKLAGKFAGVVENPNRQLADSTCPLRSILQNSIQGQITNQTYGWKAGTTSYKILTRTAGKHAGKWPEIGRKVTYLLTQPTNFKSPYLAQYNSKNYDSSCNRSQLSQRTLTNQN